MFYDDQDACPPPCDYNVLKGAMPTVGNAAGLALDSGNKITPESASLTGFDRDFVELVFTRMLGLPVTYNTFGSFTAMYLALLGGKCDVAITASQM
jgi:ABC-type amino acid transport substrate-binding protein